MAKKNKLGFELNAVPDMPDTRDWLYEPSLRPVQFPYLFPTRVPEILDQGSEGACTGFALAANINHLMEEGDRNGTRVSARMLYEMAKRHDEWPGEKYEGSSIRGAIVGWQNMGVCLEDLWSSKRSSPPGNLTIRRAKDAKCQTVGAYYRLAPKIEHFHVALMETGALYVSADVHSGWDAPKDTKGSRYPIIKFTKRDPGGHAFAIVGYNEIGFLVQNSWGPTWGKDGLAIWTYEDWNQNFMDAWVVQLAFPTPEIFGLEPQSAFVADRTAKIQRRKAPVRAEIAGHFVHVDDGIFHENGHFWSNAFDTQQTAEDVSAKREYKHLLIYAHGGLNSPKDSACRIAAMKDTFKRNGIYPYHIMYDVGLGEEIKDILVRKVNPFSKRAGNFLTDARDALTGWTDALKKKMVETADRKIEDLVRRPVTPIWEEMKWGAEQAFDKDGAGTDTLDMFLNAFANAPTKAGITKVHLVGHSTGAVVLAHLLDRAHQKRLKLDIASVSLYAPACTVELFERHYLPALATNAKYAKIAKMNVYCLDKKLELEDNVAKLYRKSLLYLVSNALERNDEEPILGMEKFRGTLFRKPAKLTFIDSSAGGRSKRTKSKTHGGFDNDPDTLNDTMKTILGRKPTNPFTREALKY